jgi:predicted NBD/HSP70 family sugar kinase
VGEEREPSDGYYLVRVPHYVLVYGAQLAAGRGGLTQQLMWRSVGGSRAHASDAIKRLRKDGYLHQTRPLALGPEVGLMVSASLGKESLRTAVVDGNGELRATYEAPAVDHRIKNQEPEQTLNDIAAAVNVVLERAVELAEVEHAKPLGSLDRKPLFVERASGRTVHRFLPILGVAVAWPMPVHRYTKHPAANDPSLVAIHDRWYGSALTDLVADRLGFPRNKVHALNDANAATIGAVFDEIRHVGMPPAELGEEQRAQAEYPPTRIAMTVRIGGGIGAGTMTIGRYSPRSFDSFNDAALLESQYGLAGEIGHVVADADSLARVNAHHGTLLPLSTETQCSCGLSGHLEALASGHAVVERLLAVEPAIRSAIGLPEAISHNAELLRSVIAQVQEGSAHATLQRALEDAGRLVGHAAAGGVLMLAPSSITLTGSAACEPVRMGFVKGLSERGAFYREGKIHIDHLSGRANRFCSARGAALAVFRELIYRQLDQFQRLTGRAGQDALGEDERLFSALMEPIGATDLPLAREHPWASRRRAEGLATAAPLPVTPAGR